MSAESALLDLLVCPETHQRLRPATAELIAQLSARAERGELRNHAGQAVSAPLQAGLVREDGKALYRLDDGLPNMLIDERIDL